MRVSKLGLWVCFVYVHESAKHVYSYLCFSEVLDMDFRNYLSRKRSRKEVDVMQCYFCPCIYSYINDRGG